MFGVEKAHNSKGVALFLQGYCNLYRAVGRKPGLASQFGGQAELLATITSLGEKLLSMRSKGDFSGFCWGYNFPWQCRREFLFKADEPTVVATQFCVSALLDAYSITHREDFKEAALSAAEFVMHDLHRTPAKDGFLFSYSREKGNDTIVNASLMGTRLLSLDYECSPDHPDWLEAAGASAKACAGAQMADGSWYYGLIPATHWIDSFHTGYNLDGLQKYLEVSGDESLREVIERGLEFYLKNFFLPDGSPKYYSTRQYPIDIHCPGQLVVTLWRLHRLKEHKALVDKVMEWTIDNMQSPEGYFYYQIKQGRSSRIPYMRWSNAFMFYALSHYVDME